MPLLQPNPLSHTFPLQQTSPPPPHAVQTFLLQVSSDAQQVPLQSGVAQTHDGGEVLPVQVVPDGQQRGMPVPCPPQSCPLGQQPPSAQVVPVPQQLGVPLKQQLSPPGQHSDRPVPESQPVCPGSQQTLPLQFPEQHPSPLVSHSWPSGMVPLPAHICWAEHGQTPSTAIKATRAMGTWKKRVARIMWRPPLQRQRLAQIKSSCQVGSTPPIPAPHLPDRAPGLATREPHLGRGVQRRAWLARFRGLPVSGPRSSAGSAVTDH